MNDINYSIFPKNKNLMGVINIHLAFDLGERTDRGYISLLSPIGKILATLPKQRKKCVLNSCKNNFKEKATCVSFQGNTEQISI